LEKVNFVKKINLVFIITLCFGLLFIGCFKNEGENNESEEILTKRPEYKDFIRDYSEILLYLRSNYTVGEVKSMSKYYYSSEGVEDIENHKYLVFNNRIDLFYNKNYSFINELNVLRFPPKLRKLMEEDLKVSFLTYYSKFKSSELESRAPCNSFRLAICDAAVAVEGAALLAACEVATLGVGTPLCVAGAVTFAANGMNDCALKHCPDAAIF
jgi:hypothetical protein